MSRSGFSLVEALVAITIAALVLLAVFELQHQLADGQRRYEQALALAGVQRNAIVLMEGVNPMAEPEGQRALSSGRVMTWRAVPLTPVRPGVGYPSGRGQFDVRLYHLEVTILGADGRRLSSLGFDRLGWRDTRTPGISGKAG